MGTTANDDPRTPPASAFVPAVPHQGSARGTSTGTAPDELFIGKGSPKHSVPATQVGTDTSGHSSTTTSTTQAPPSQPQPAEAYAYHPGDRVFTLRPLRQHWWQVWRWRNPPPPPLVSMDDASQLPIGHSNWLSYTFFDWMTPLMVLGYRRPLEATDLWKMDDSRQAEYLSNRLLQHWDTRVQRAESYNASIAKGERTPGRWTRLRWSTNYLVMGKMLRNTKALGLPPSQRAKLWSQPPPPGAYTPKPPKGAPIPPGGFPPIPENYSGYQRPSLVMAVHDGFKKEIWLATLFRLLADMLQLLSTLVLKKMITFGQDVYAAHKYPESGIHAPAIGRGIGMAIGLFLMSLFAALAQHHFFFRGQSNGIFVRAALISSIFARGLNMNGQDRAPGKLTNHISTDCSRIDFAANWCVVAVTAPIQLIVALIILLCQIGVSALAGYAVLLAAILMLMHAMVLMFQARKQSMVWTDKRAKAIAEILSSMRIVKSFGFEPDFLDRLHTIRTNELHGIRSLLLLRSATSAVAFSSTVLGSVVAFVVYSLTGHTLDAAKIFSSLTLFNLTRMPLMILPLALSSSTDAYNAFLRLQGVFEAPLVQDENLYDSNSEDGIRLDNVSFQWSTIRAEDHVNVDGAKVGDRTKRSWWRKRPATTPGKVEQVTTTAENDTTQTRFGPGNTDPVMGGATAAVGPQLVEVEAQDDKQSTQELESDQQPTDQRTSEPFALRNLSLSIKRGELCAIVGAVGSGKSSLLEGCIGEMKRLGGSVTWGSRAIGYCPQTAWIRSATLRDNITFGRPFDAGRYWNVIRVSELTNDLKMLQAGDLSEIGEKGVTLSGGQKQRVNIARALYSDPDVYLFDDPLSALDAHVGKSVFWNAIVPLREAGKTVILVTHALQYLSACDRVLVMDKGIVVQSGGYQHLIDSPGPFKELIAEFGAKGSEEEHVEDEEQVVDQAVAEHDQAMTNPEPTLPMHEETKEGKDVEKQADDDQTKQDGTLVQAEERNTGAVGAKVYGAYAAAGYGWVLVPATLASTVLMQATQVLNSYWLVWWQEDAFHSTRGMYMGVYAALGVGQAIFTFLMGASMGYLSYYACKRLHARAMFRTMYAPMSFMDTTPQGRIMSRFAKDIDVLDNQLQDSVRMLITTMASVLGSVILITVLAHYFVAIVAFVLILYVLGAVFYRSSAREIKRVDSLLRSALYSHFAESLAGIGTLRAYGVTGSILRENYTKVDEENRAYFLTVTAPRWLGTRLDVIGSLLILVVGLILVCTAESLSPGQVGVALSYIVTTAQGLTMATRQVAEVENNMNAVERILYYADALPQEAEQVTSSTAVLRSSSTSSDSTIVGQETKGLPPQWPENGQIELRNIQLRYRPELPLVLKGITMHVPGGCKVGIVGRTGAGKSSLLGALLRLTELDAGSIIIDGIDISQLGLRDLRRRLAILPQDPLLFSGTLRSNLDPFGQWDDARLWDALQRSTLVGPPGTPTGPGGSEALSLDMPMEEGGLNLSLGQRSLVSLARALCKSSKVILLDEATASADSATDAKVQATIRDQFADRTLLCIAHRLATILSYDQIAVFSQGLLVEYAPPLTLFDDPNSHFHDMCLKAGVGREDILVANGWATPATPATPDVPTSVVQKQL